MSRSRVSVHLKDRAGTIERSAIPGEPPSEGLHRTNMRVVDIRHTTERKLGAQKADIKADVMPHESRVADKLPDLPSMVGEGRLEGNQMVREAMDPLGGRMTFPTWIEDEVQAPPRRLSAEGLDCREADHAVAAVWAQAGGFTVDDLREESGKQN